MFHRDPLSPRSRSRRRRSGDDDHDSGCIPSGMTTTFCCSSSSGVPSFPREERKEIERIGELLPSRPPSKPTTINRNESPVAIAAAAAAAKTNEEDSCSSSEGTSFTLEETIEVERIGETLPSKPPATQATIKLNEAPDAIAAAAKTNEEDSGTQDPERSVPTTAFTTTSAAVSLSVAASSIRPVQKEEECLYHHGHRYVVDHTYTTISISEPQEVNEEEEEDWDGSQGVGAGSNLRSQGVGAGDVACVDSPRSVAAWALSSIARQPLQPPSPPPRRQYNPTIATTSAAATTSLLTSSSSSGGESPSSTSSSAKTPQTKQQPLESTASSPSSPSPLSVLPHSGSDHNNNGIDCSGNSSRAISTATTTTIPSPTAEQLATSSSPGYCFRPMPQNSIRSCPTTATTNGTTTMTSHRHQHHHHNDDASRPPPQPTQGYHNNHHQFHYNLWLLHNYQQQRNNHHKTERPTNDKLGIDNNNHCDGDGLQRQSSSSSESNMKGGASTSITTNTMTSVSLPGNHSSSTTVTPNGIPHHHHHHNNTSHHPYHPPPYWPRQEKFRSAPPPPPMQPQWWSGPVVPSSRRHSYCGYENNHPTPPPHLPFHSGGDTTKPTIPYQPLFVSKTAPPAPPPHSSSSQTQPHHYHPQQQKSTSAVEQGKSGPSSLSPHPMDTTKDRRKTGSPNGMGAETSTTCPPTGTTPVVVVSTSSSAPVPPRRMTLTTTPPSSSGRKRQKTNGTTNLGKTTMGCGDGEGVGNLATAPSGPNRHHARDPSSYSRKKKSLGVLAHAFLEQHRHAPRGTVAVIDQWAQTLGVERRRIYDVVNILEAFALVVKKGKNTYHWMGTDHVPIYFAILQREAFRHYPHDAQAAGLLQQTPTDDDKGDDDDQNLGPSITFPSNCGQRRIDTTCGRRTTGPASEDLGRRDDVGDSNDGNSYNCRSCSCDCICTNRRPTKSLSRLSQQFLQVFLVGHPVVSLADASDKIHGTVTTLTELALLGVRGSTTSVGGSDSGKMVFNGREEDHPRDRHHDSSSSKATQDLPRDPELLQRLAARGLKTKIRRLYDIANVLTATGYLAKVEDPSCPLAPKVASNLANAQVSIGPHNSCESGIRATNVTTTGGGRGDDSTDFYQDCQYQQRRPYYKWVYPLDFRQIRKIEQTIPLHQKCPFSVPVPANQGKDNHFDAHQHQQRPRVTLPVPKQPTPRLERHHQRHVLRQIQPTLPCQTLSTSPGRKPVIRSKMVEEPRGDAAVVSSCSLGGGRRGDDAAMPSARTNC